MRATYQVNEIFDSLQGEGYWTGVPATFIRLQGCTVGCPWCDSGPDADKIWGRQTNGLTRNTWARGGKRMTVDDIVDQVHEEHVVITGGEPTLYNLDPLLEGLFLDNKNHFTQLETSGQQWLKGNIMPKWITWSPKEMLSWNAPMHYYEFANEVKWVVELTLPFEQIVAVHQFARIHGRSDLLMAQLMPEGCPPKPCNIELAIEYTRKLRHLGFKAFFSDRLQYRLGIR